MAASRPLRRPLLAASLLVAAVSAQTSGSFSFLPSSASSTFPECGLSCTVLQTAQAVCVPPQAAVTNDQTYISCFCQSAYLRGLTSSGAVCSSCTNPADQQLLVNWYNGYCAGGYTSTLTATATTTSTTNTATNGATTTTAAASTSTASSSSKPSGSPSWFSTHWRWVVMLIVLAVAFTALGIFGTWYKKRHDARRPGLYHGDDRRNMTASGGYRGDGPAAAGFFSGSLRNLSKGNANSINNPSTTNSSNNNVAVSSKSVAAATTTTTRSKRQPSMSMIRSSIISNNDNNNNNYSNNNNHMWGPHQATAHTRDFDDITPVDGTAFRNSMAAAAAAAAIEKTGTMTTTTTAPNNASRTDISSIGTGGRSRSGSVAAGRAPTPRSNTNNGNSTNRLSKLSVHSSSTLQRQTSSNTLPRGPTPAPRSNELSPVSPIGDDE